MQRFTYSYNGLWWQNFNVCKDERLFAERLAAYEDTGLEPHEIQTILDNYGRGFTAKTAHMDELKAYRSIGTVEELCTLKEAEQKEQPMILKQFKPKDFLDDLQEYIDESPWPNKIPLCIAWDCLREYIKLGTVDEFRVLKENGKILPVPLGTRVYIADDEECKVLDGPITKAFQLPGMSEVMECYYTVFLKNYGQRYTDITVREMNNVWFLKKEDAQRALKRKDKYNE